MATTQARPFLMFTGQAEEAMKFYVSLFANSEITEVQKWGAGAPSPEGTVMRAAFRVAGQSVLCTDSPPVHKFTFTPSWSFFVDCASEDELRKAAAKLGEGGGVLMPLGNYGFSRLFTWVTDRFGVSWQLNFP